VSFPVTVIIATRDRKEDVCNALRSVLLQDLPLEIIVADDASTDGTAEAVSSGFPQVHVLRSEEWGGSTAARNLAASKATGYFLVFLDDDVLLPDQTTLSRSLLDFDDPVIGAVAIPFINVNRDGVLRQRSPDSKSTYVTSTYTGCAAAVRRDLFVSLGGYRTSIKHMNEEVDFCLRMLDAGYVTKLGTAQPVLHLAGPHLHRDSPRREARRDHILGRRSDILSEWCNAPALFLPMAWFRSILRGFNLGIQTRRLGWSIEGLLYGFGACLRFFRERRPVSTTTYRLAQRLRRRGPIRLDEIAETR
jgi:GT2 family glycosyltransferase